ncbi:MAG: hypothetical protein MR897_08130, partial [Bacteroidales bacterium]|nr:hypothetical protein [Bacteroidales bacterium]MCI7033376.1 hypothetical protein [Bacteroidales bacterium]
SSVEQFCPTLSVFEFCAKKASHFPKFKVVSKKLDKVTTFSPIPHTPTLFFHRFSWFSSVENLWG